MNKKWIYSLWTAMFFISLVGCSNETVEEKQDHKAENQAEGQQAHWSYEGEAGPIHWGELDPAYAPCVNGQEQSPIHIETAKVVAGQQAEDLEIKYVPMQVSVVNNGHTIQANVKTNESAIKIAGKEYMLVQFHFHKPSEHQVDGKNFAMELHLVHKNEKDQLAVLGVLVKEGAVNETLSNMWKELPQKETSQAITFAEPIDLVKLLPTNQQSFRYNGSLTTPPCTEGVKWVVFEEPIEMSKEQIEAFGKIFPDNHRPVQPIHQREVMS